MIARVEPLTTTRRLSGPFDYRLPADPVDVGSIVRVPFGRQALDGVVVALADATEVPDEKLVTPTAVRGESVPGELVELALWMAREYCSTPARALSLVLPPRGRERTQLWASRTAVELDGQRLTDNQRATARAAARARRRRPRRAAAARGARAGGDRAARAAAGAAHQLRRGPGRRAHAASRRRRSISCCAGESTCCTA